MCAKGCFAVFVRNIWMLVSRKEDENSQMRKVVSLVSRDKKPLRETGDLHSRFA